MSSALRPKVAYVLGVYRSGTTLLSNLMGQLDGFFCVGELRAIWRELGLATARCGCGLPLIECEVWRDILKAAFGGTDEAQRLSPRMLRWQEQALRQTHTWLRVPSLLSHRDLRSMAGSARAYAEGMARLYHAIARVTGARVIVDSSKEPTDAVLIRLFPNVSTALVHIVRDPRGTVFSSIRARSELETSPQSHMTRSSYAALSWMAGNVAAGAVRRAHGRQGSLLVRYEDLVQTPKPTLESIARFLGEPVTVSLAEDGVMVVAPTHSVAGNPNRFRTGWVTLVRDTAWERHLTRRDRIVVSAICSPLMMRYRYPMKSRGGLSE